MQFVYLLYHRVYVAIGVQSCSFLCHFYYTLPSVFACSIYDRIEIIVLCHGCTGACATDPHGSHTHLYMHVIFM